MWRTCSVLWAIAGLLQASDALSTTGLVVTSKSLVDPSLVRVVDGVAYRLDPACKRDRFGGRVTEPQLPPGWEMLTGQLTQATAGEGSLLEVKVGIRKGRTVYVKGLKPGQYRDEDWIDDAFCYVGTQRYESIGAGTRTVMAFDYGTEPTAAQLAQFEEQELAKSTVVLKPLLAPKSWTDPSLLRIVNGVVYDLKPECDRTARGLDPRPPWEVLTGRIIQARLGEGSLLMVERGKRRGHTVYVKGPDHGKWLDGARINDAFCYIGAHRYEAGSGKLLTAAAFDYGAKPTAAQLAQLEEQQRLQSEQLAEKKRLEELRKKEDQDARTLEFLQGRAKQGSAAAACSLGIRYLKGDGVPVDTDLARKWLSTAAAGGNVEASNILATLQK